MDGWASKNFNDFPYSLKKNPILLHFIKHWEMLIQQDIFKYDKKNLQLHSLETC